MYCAGLDVGSITAKAAIVGNGQILASAITFSGYNSAETAHKVLAEALGKAGLRRDAIARLVATGYGRVRVPGADRQVTEITCHARGAYWLHPETRTIIDVGGQDSKGIVLNDQGKVTDFVMNDKCAAGTGRFLEVMARAMEEDLDHFGELGLAAPRRAQISSTCTVFAESEVISQIAAGVPKDAIIAGIHDAIAARISGMVQRIAVRDQVVMTGGVARNAGVAHMLQEKLGRPILVLPEAQITGAIGAALIAQELDE
jgi:predicted CoA-substrate-specific enzyme activase